MWKRFALSWTSNHGLPFSFQTIIFRFSNGSLFIFGGVCWKNSWTGDFFGAHSSFYFHGPPTHWKKFCCLSFIHPFPGLSYIAAREKSPSSEVRYFKKRPLRHQYNRLVPTDVRSQICSRPLLSCHTSFCGSCTWTFTVCCKMLVLAHLHRPVLTLPRPNYQGSPPSPSFLESKHNASTV